jgi:hypothetical protein
MKGVHEPGSTVVVLQSNDVLKEDRSLEWPHFFVSQVCFHGDGLIKKNIIM